ncbi:MAG TPA: tetratricopeptide repeat protein, partial [Phycisphaerae bacterium]|nr:tetratricopeptide repeat protein [Phycisphaerae bacterium]
RHEAHILAQLRHPGIAHIYEAAVAQVSLADGIQAAQPYFAMELVEGQPLRTFVESRKLDIRRRLELMILVCEAVQHAHEKGVIHRDLKSENILIETSGRPRILDFGVARLVALDDEPATLHTRAGEIVGTLAYMSPEQVAGDSTQVDTRSDVYSLGVILYDLLTGRLPHIVSGLTLAEAARRIRDDEPLPPSAHDARLRGEVDWIVMKCIEKDRARRYQSAGEFARDLRHYLSGEPIDARRDSTWYVLKKTLSRRRGTVVALSAVLLALMLGVIGTAWQAVRAARERDQAAEQALRATETVKLLKRVIRSATPEMAQGESPTVRAMLDAASLDMTRDESIHPLVAADTHGALADAYDSLGEFARAEGHARMAFDLRTVDQGPNNPDTLEDASTLARILSRLDRDDEAVRTCREALDVARAELGPDHPASIALTMNYAFVLSFTPSPDQPEVIRWTREGYERCRNVYGTEDQHTLRAATDLGVTLMEAGKLDEAEALLRSVFATRQRLLGDDHPDVFLSLNNLVALLNWREDLPGAIELGLQVLERADRILGPDHPRTCQYAFNLATLYGQLGRWEEVERYARRAMVAAARLGPAHHNVLKSRGVLATSLIEVKRLDEAAPLVKEHYDLCMKELGPKHPDTVQAITVQFDLAKAHGRLDQMRHWADALRGSQWEKAVSQQIEDFEREKQQKSSGDQDNGDR